MFAVISHKGNQYKVEPNKQYEVDLIDQEISTGKKNTFTFSDVLLYSDNDKVEIGNPSISGATVEAELVENVRDDKVTVFKFKSKKRYKRTRGHRQDYTVIKITKINLKNEK